MNNQKYHISLRVLHWLMAIFIFVMLALGLYMEGLDKTYQLTLFNQVYRKYDLYSIHKSFGILALILVAIRLVVMITTRTPQYPVSISERSILLAKSAHHFIYLLMFLIPISGYIMSVSGGHKVEFFGITTRNLLPPNKWLEEIAHETHEILGYIIIFTLIIHVAMVIKHKIISKINIIDRIL